MQYEKYVARVKYLEELIKKEATGPPKALADKLGISERMVYRYLAALDGNPKSIKFCRIKNTYRFIEY